MVVSVSLEEEALELSSLLDSLVVSDELLLVTLSLMLLMALPILFEVELDSIVVSEELLAVLALFCSLILALI